MILCDIICRLYVSPQWAGTSWHMERVHLSAELRKRRDVALLSYLHHLLWNSECLMETCCANFRVHNLALGLQALMLKKHIAPSTKFPVSSDWPAHKHLSQHRSPCIRACNKSHRGQPTRCFQAFQDGCRLMCTVCCFLPLPVFLHVVDVERDTKKTFLLLKPRESITC